MSYNLKFGSNNVTSKNIFITVLLGVISAVLGLIELETPGYEGSYSDLREIALLICLFHITNPLYIIPLCLITLLGLPLEPRLVAVFIMHVIPLVTAWYIFRWLEKKELNTVQLGLVWCMVVIFYYCVLLYPILIVTYRWVGFNEDLNFTESYKSIFASGIFEMIASSLVTSLYLVQLNIRRSLEHTNRYLEEIVRQRTQELTDANYELKSLNENLEQIIAERTNKINAQLTQIKKYVNMNSHEVRAPLARILGLLGLINQEKKESERKILLKKLNENSLELDEIVRKMNRLLEEETASE